MNPTKLLKLLIFLLMARKCVAITLAIDTSQQEKTSNLVKAVAKMLTSCYETGTLGIAGRSPESLIISLSSEGPVVIIDNNTPRSLMDTEQVSPDIRYKLHLFVIAASSWVELRESLGQIKSTRWWNHMAHFYLIDWPISEDGCFKAEEYLWTAWYNDLLEAKFVCIDERNGLMIYTFNPYTKDAPEPWKFVRTISGHTRYDDPWTLLTREYREDGELCENMNFDRTKNLGGYPVRVLRVRWSWDNLVSNFFPDEYRVVVRYIHLKPFGSMIITPMYQDVDSELEASERRESWWKKDNGMEERDDVEVVSRDQLIWTNMTPTYPHYQYRLRVVTHYRGDESQFQKFLHVTDFHSRICMCLVGLVTLIYLKFFARQTPGIAALNLIRMISNGAFTNSTNDAASRIYIAGLLIFVVTIQGIYQGQWSALLAKRKPLKDINTMQDLIDSDCKFYVSDIYSRYFDDPVFEGRVIVLMSDVVSSTPCTKHLLADSSAACVDAEQWSIDHAWNRKLHMSSDSIVKMYLTFSVRKNWPLEERFNSNIQRLVEAGTFQHMYGLLTVDEELRIKADNIKDTERVVKVLTPDDLGFAFVILGIGLGYSLICFIIEIAVSRRECTRIAKIPRYIRNQALNFSHTCQMAYKKISSVLRNFFSTLYSIVMGFILSHKPKPFVLRNPRRNRVSEILRRISVRTFRRN